MTPAHMLAGMTKADSYIAGMTSPDLMTADELARLSLQNKRTELVRGQLVVREPAGFRHGVVAARVARHLEEFATKWYGAWADMRTVG